MDFYGCIKEGLIILQSFPPFIILVLLIFAFTNEAEINHFDFKALAVSLVEPLTD